MQNENVKIHAKQFYYLCYGDHRIRHSSVYDVSGNDLQFPRRSDGTDLRIYRHGGLSEPYGGVLGELSLGHAGFMSVGAFSGVVAAISLQSVIPNGALRLIAAVIIAGAVTAVAGILIGIPVLRLKGDYLAIVTLAFGEIIKNILNNLYVGVDGSGLHVSMSSVKELGMDAGTVIINGPMGAVGITKLSTFFAGFVLILITLFVTLNLIKSRSGRAIMAMS